MAVLSDIGSKYQGAELRDASQSSRRTVCEEHCAKS